MQERLAFVQARGYAGTPIVSVILITSVTRTTQVGAQIAVGDTFIDMTKVNLGTNTMDLAGSSTLTGTVE